MDIYVAGKFEERKEIKKVINKIKSKGHNITWDWTDELPTPSQEDMRKFAVNDFNGVYNCDTFILIALKDNSYRGSMSELGMAIALGKTVWVVGHAVDNNIFIHLINAQFENLKELYKCV